METTYANRTRRNRKSWILFPVLGVTAMLGMVTFGYVVITGASAVTGMGTWPGRDIDPEQVASLDLAHLGLNKTRTFDAKTAGRWKDGNYQAGVIAFYSKEQTERVAVGALQYSDQATARRDFQSVTQWAKENCRWSTYVYWMNSGVVRCGLPGVHDRIVWNGWWILNITALERDQSPAQTLVDQVMTTFSATWNEPGESSH